MVLKQKWTWYSNRSYAINGEPITHAGKHIWETTAAAKNSTMKNAGARRYYV
jgi:hypothetical protein